MPHVLDHSVEIKALLLVQSLLPPLAGVQLQLELRVELEHRKLTHDPALAHATSREQPAGNREREEMRGAAHHKVTRKMFPMVTSMMVIMLTGVQAQ